MITYVGLALDTAQTRKHEIIQIEDLASARRRFSDSRLKDLGDEYQENYPQIALVLSRFYGLGGRWTLRSLGGLLARLLVDDQIRVGCEKWIFEYATEEAFARLLYAIGFLGFAAPSRRGGIQPKPVFRSLGPSDTTPPPLTSNTDLHIHPSYWDALDLQDVLIQDFTDVTPFGRAGLQLELPESIDFEIYRERLQELLGKLKSVPCGKTDAAAFEDAVGDALELCFFRSLANIKPQVRDDGGTIRRDWVASDKEPRWLLEHGPAEVRCDMGRF